MGEITHHVAPVKKDIVKNIVRAVREYPIIGIVNMENLPAAQLQKMRRQLRGKIDLFMTKITLTNRALDEGTAVKKNVGELKQFVKGMPALLFTKENPFSLFKTLKKSKSPAPAKPGQNAPRDIVIPAGPTPFTPGPVISEFAALGIKAGVEGGKVAVKQDTVVCKEGQPLSPALASMLTRLGIEPMEVGLDLVAVYENGVIYPKNVLDIDEIAFMSKVISAASEGFNLAIEIALPTKDTIEVLVQKCFREAKSVAVEGKIMTDAVVEAWVEQAEREMLALKSAAKITVEEHQKQKESVAEVKKDIAKEPNIVDKMVAGMKQHKDEKPSAEELVQDIQKDTAKTQNEKKEIDDVAALAKKLVKKGTLR